jgi:uncharacterized protein YcbX
MMPASELRLSSIVVYPVKSCTGIEVDAAAVDRFGLRGDRRWMLVDTGGRFLSQRELPSLALIGASPLPDGGLLLTQGGSRCPVAVPGPGEPPVEVEIWQDRVMAVDAGDGAAAWLSEVVERDCRLIYMPEECHRPVDPAYARGGETVSFADGFPLLLTTEASLAALNARLEQPVPMNRFRPNLVVSGCQPFAEDDWCRIRIGTVEFALAKPCSRCVVPSIDQATGSRDPAISRVLAGFRRFDGQILFGQNLLQAGNGVLRRGDRVERIE